MSKTITAHPEFFAEHLVRITFCFRDEEEKNSFLGSLIDGWGENHVQTQWPWAANRAVGGSTRDAFTVKNEDFVEDE